jgi:hypothetical protein
MEFFEPRLSYYHRRMLQFANRTFVRRRVTAGLHLLHASSLPAFFENLARPSPENYQTTKCTHVVAELRRGKQQTRIE